MNIWKKRKKLIVSVFSVLFILLIGYRLAKDKVEIINHLILGDKERVYHQIGIPTEVKRANETYIQSADIYVTKNEKDHYGIEWVRHGANCPMPELVKKTPHVAFIVKDMSKEISGKKVIFGPIQHPEKDVVIAFIDNDGAPIELIQIGKLLIENRVIER